MFCTSKQLSSLNRVLRSQGFLKQHISSKSDFFLNYSLSRSVVRNPFLHSRAFKSFGNLSVLNKGFFLTKITGVLSGRAGLYRLLIVASLIHILATVGGSLFAERVVMMSVSDYVSNITLNENEVFKLFGAVKQGSIQMKRGALDTKFVVTDYKNEIEVIYSGTAKFEFKEGETIVLTGYVPDTRNRNRIVCVEYMTKHSMQVENWQDQQNISRRNYGLNNSKSGEIGKDSLGYTRIA
eukprot:TRINITY_DN3192_c0_g1_i1.p1 TRINITY_DN3192_c0_g1~~TRINITY_DN3192_c0_g1_i1.p1  ORF type:complete len:238 (+),score=26.54 TRINITY_DN3192_c0_g1_i1:54-767(+)